MKKILVLFFILLFYSPASFATEPCGKTFKYFANDVTYLLKFSDKVEEFPCTSGTVSFCWFDNKLEYSFSVDSNDFIKITGLGYSQFIMTNFTILTPRKLSWKSFKLCQNLTFLGRVVSPAFCAWFIVFLRLVYDLRTNLK